MSDTTFAPISVTDGEDLSWVFLVYWIFALIASLSVLFYLNRLFGFLISYICKLILWKRWSIRIKVKSIKVSFLGGRIFFKNLLVITENETISIVQGTFTWRYWLTFTRKSNYRLENLESQNESSRLKNDSLPSRFLLQAYGHEVFVYNRVDAYLNLLKSINKSDEYTKEEETSYSTTVNSSGLRHRGSMESPVTSSTTMEKDTSDSEECEHRQSPFSFLKFLPIDFDIKTGALVVGNDETSSILVLTYQSCEGAVNSDVTSSKLDLYRLAVTARLEKFRILLKPNVKYGEHKTDAHPTFKRKLNQKAQNLQRSKLFRRFFKRAAFNLIPPLDESAWHGLRQYVSEEDELAEMIHLQGKEEYARQSLILSSELCKITYYYDAPGLVPQFVEPTDTDFDGVDIGNSGPPPLTGLDVSLSHVSINYGPWADRQRFSIQQMLFPTICRDSEPHSRLKPGDRRIYTRFKFFVNVEDEGVFRIPLREPSKDHALALMNLGSKKREAAGSAGQSLAQPQRAFGWIDLRMGESTTLATETSYVATESGWKNDLRICITEPEVRTSVNHDVYFRAKKHTVVADIGSPLKWNGHTDWSFHNYSQNLEAFLLREQVTLLIDLFDDLSSGAPTPYELFRSFKYNLFWRITQYDIYTITNDFNIINNPLDFMQNCYVDFKGDALDLKVTIPFDAVYRKSNTVLYEIFTDSMNVVLCTPPWHTTNAFMKNKHLACANKFKISGSYNYFTGIDIGSIDTIVINCTCENTTLEAYGFLIRYAMIIKENYFGEHLHFRTLEEYTSALNEPKEPSVLSSEEQDELKTETKVNTRLENEIDVWFSFCVDGGMIALPGHMYDCASRMALCFDALDIDIRFTNYYMDLQADFTPISGSLQDHCDPTVICEFMTRDQIMHSAHSLSIEGLSVHGHRMFGLPPLEPTYLCDWEFEAGEILMDTTFRNLHRYQDMFAKCGFGYNDTENALVVDLPILCDVTSLSFQTPLVGIKACTDEFSLDFSLKEVVFRANDLANDVYTGRIDLEIPSIVVEAFQDGSTIFLTTTSLHLTDFEQKFDFDEFTAAQQEHLRNHDGPFHRLPFTIFEKFRSAKYSTDYGTIKPAISLPDAPAPLTPDTVNLVFEEFPPFSQQMSHQDSLSDGGSSRRKSVLSMSSFRTPNPDYDYDNFVVSLGEVKVEMKSQFAQFLADALDQFFTFTINSVMDVLQMDVINRLQGFLETVSTVANVEVWCPRIGVDLNEDFGRASLVLQQLSFQMCNRTTRKPSDSSNLLNRTILTNELIGAINIGLAEFQITNPHSLQPPVCSLVLKDLEAWGSSSSSGNVGSFSPKVCACDLELDQVEWMSLYVERLISLLEPLTLVPDILKRNHSALVELVYGVTTSSIQHKVEHDPGVITRPAYVVRSSDFHIRGNDSWKVITRLRHVIHYLPAEWFSATTERFKKCQWEAPPNALEVVLNMFSEWRSWEFADIAHSFIFRHIFRHSFPSVEERCGGVLHAEVEAIQLRLPCGGMETNFLCAEAIKVEGKMSSALPLDMSGIANIAFIETRVNSSLLKLKCLVGETKPKGPSESLIPSSLNLVCTIGEARNVVSLNRTSAKVYLNDIAACVFSSTNLEGDGLNVQLDAANMDCQILKSHVVYSTQNIKNGSLAVSSCTSLDTGLKHAAMGADSFSISFDRTMEELCELYEVVADDVESLAKEVNQLGIADQNPESSGIGFPFTATLRVNQIRWRAEKIIAGFSLQGTVDRLIMYVQMVESLLSFNVTVERISSDLSSSFKHVKWDVSKTDVSGKVLQNADFSVLELSTRVGSTIVRVPTIDRSIEEISSQAQVVSEILSRVCQKLKALKGESSQSSRSLPLYVKSINVVNSFTLLISIDNAQLKVESQEASFNMYNYRKGFIKSDVYGEMRLPLSRFYVIDKSVSRDLAKCLEVDFSIKVTNPEDNNGKVQTLQVESYFCRLMVNAPILEVLVRVGVRLSKLNVKMDAPSREKSNMLEDVETFLSFYAVHLLSYNMSAGFLFERDEMYRYSGFPGIICGYERVFMVHEKGVGKFTLLDAYLSVAHGFTSNDFFPQKSEFSSQNRAFLPSVQFVYAVTDTGGVKALHSRLSGEKLDVKCESTLMEMGDKCAKSITQLQRIFRNVEFPKDVGSQSHSTAQVKFTHLDCVMIFGGAKVLIYKPNADGETENSLELVAPGVKIATEYRQTEEGRRNVLKSKTFITASSNTISALSVPVIVDLDHGFKTFLRNLPTGSSGPGGPTVTPETSRGKQSDDVTDGVPGSSFMDMLSRLKLDMAIHIEPQTIRLSCEPTAKVLAEVGIEHIRIHLNTIGNHKMVAASLHFEKTRVALQHIYSRETSGSVNVEQIFLTAMMDLTKSKKVVTAAYLSDISSYVDVKQLHDLYLFRDIWIPRELFEDEETQPNETAGPNNIISNIAPTSPLPWSVSLTILNTKCSVNLGKSLGFLELHVDRFWAFSKKNASMEQNMKLGMDKVSLSSTGRLGGSLMAHQVVLHTAINWQVGPEEIPLVLIGCGFHSLDVKASFDYHTFFIMRLCDVAVRVFNQNRTPHHVNDRISGNLSIGSIQVFLTALSGSNFIDIYNSLLRMHNDNRLSYKEVLRDSSSHPLFEKPSHKRHLGTQQVFEKIHKLCTRLDLNIGETLVHVYPSTFQDRQMLVLHLGACGALFYQNTSEELVNKLQLRLTDLTVSLSTNKQNGQGVEELSVEEFARGASHAKGGTIFVFPTLVVAMKIWQKLGSNIVRFTYESHFGGRVEVRWNLGHINFIREMWTTHAKALSSRLISLEKGSFEGVEDLEKSKRDAERSILHTAKLDGKIKGAEIGSHFQYVPIEEPIIEAPQLKDLGNATPPLEWFGLHRKKFPDLTHQVIIIGLQKLVREAETQYGRVLV